MSSSPTRNTTLDDLPDELLCMIFASLADIGPCWDEDDPWWVKSVPFRTQDTILEPHPRLRAYPFLGQVCKKWLSVLSTPVAQDMIWRSLVVDFGHELVTSVHTPLKWSNQRPPAGAFEAAWADTNLSGNKVLDFVSERANRIRSLALCNSEGMWGDEGEYLNISHKHGFTGMHLGFALGLLRSTLTSLTLVNCNDVLGAETGLWAMAPTLRRLTSLRVESMRSRITPQAVSELGRITGLTKLILNCDDLANTWQMGLATLPDAWSKLQSLQVLELRNHSLLERLPVWLKDIASLRKLDVSGCAAISLDMLPSLTQLHTLVLQRLDMAQPVATAATATTGNNAAEATAASAAALPMANLQNNNAVNPPAVAGWVQVPANVPAGAPGVHVEFAAVPVAAAAGMDLDLNPRVKRHLPDLGPLGKSLTALSLSSNRFTSLPACLSKLTSIELLDFRDNKDLQIISPLTALASMPRLRLVDLRGIHVDKSVGYWGPKKCETVMHVARLAKLLKRRPYTTKVLVDGE